MPRPMLPAPIETGTPEPRAAAPTPPGAPRAPKRRRLRVVVFVLAVLVVLLARPASHHARAASMLVAFADPAVRPVVTEERLTFRREGEEVPARLYRPSGVSSPPGMVLVHGVHRLGIDEPRLERLARSIAGASG